jgi:hypothetical protein
MVYNIIQSIWLFYQIHGKPLNTCSHDPNTTLQEQFINIYIKKWNTTKKIQELRQKEGQENRNTAIGYEWKQRKGSDKEQQWDTKRKNAVMTFEFSNVILTAVRIKL